MLKTSVCSVETETPINAFINRIITGDCRQVIASMPDNSVDLSFWSPPYHVGKSYEAGVSFRKWQTMLREAINGHFRIIKPGGFMVINIADILSFVDEKMPRIQANMVRGKRNPVTKHEILRLKEKQPDATHGQLGTILGCSVQTIDRRLGDNNVRGGKQAASTRVLLTGEMVASMAEAAGFYLYDQRIWSKGPSWRNSRWHSVSYRAVDEFEHIYVFWCPGIVEYDRERLNSEEWGTWGSRGVWEIDSVGKHDRHEAEFPEELASRVIRLFSGVDGVVLDPFVGSGTTTAVAKRLGRQWIGIEVEAGAAGLARQRIKAID